VNLDRNGRVGSKSDAATQAEKTRYGVSRKARSKEEVAQWIRANKDPLAKRLVDEWREIGANEVWHGLPPSMGFDHLPDVIAGLAETALAGDFERAAVEESLRLSAVHGEHRQIEGFPEQFIYTEYHLLRRSMWHFLGETVAPDDAARSVSRIDVAITLATMAALRGFHKSTFEERGDWPAALYRVLDEMPIPIDD
jgi:hypothetical protein